MERESPAWDENAAGFLVGEVKESAVEGKRQR